MSEHVEEVVRLCTFAADMNAIDHLGDSMTEAERTKAAVDTAIRYGIQNRLLSIPDDVDLDAFFPTRIVP